MEKWVYDIEIFPNYLLIIFKNLNTKEERIVYLYNDEGNLEELNYFFNSNIYLIGYNNNYYDNLIINYIYKNINYVTNTKLYDLSSYIINNRDIDEDYHKKLRPYKYPINYKSIDLLTMLFSKKLRVSLKHLQIMLKWHNVLECDISFNSIIEDKHLDTVKFYCHNDVDFTMYLANYSKDDIDLRFKIRDQYRINSLSYDGVKLGAEIYIKAIADKLNKSPRDIRSMRFIHEPFYLRDIVNDFIEFKDPILKNLLEDINNFEYECKVNNYEKQIIFRDTIYSIGSGGLHSLLKNKIFEPKDNEFYWQVDAGSYYPCQRNYLNYEHELLGNLFKKADGENLERRFEAKRNKNKTEDITRKLSLNGVFGLMGQEHSCFFSPRLLMASTIENWWSLNEVNCWNNLKIFKLQHRDEISPSVNVKN